MRRTLLAQIGIKSDLGFAGNPFLGSNDDDPVGTACSIYGSRGGIFQDVDGLDVLRVDVAQTGTDHPVDDHQRLGGTGDGVLSAYIDLKALSRLVAGLGDHHTGDLTLQCLRDVGRVSTYDITGSQ